jgi:hypothetical protein
VSRIALQGISSRERELLLLMMPRGLITAVLAVQVVQAKGEEFLFLPSNPPKFGDPSLLPMDPGQVSDIYTVYLGGSCDAHKRIYIRVVSIEDNQGAQMQPKTGASRSAAFGTTTQSGVSTQSATTKGNSGHSETAAAANTHKNVVPPARGATSDFGGTS